MTKKVVWSKDAPQPVGQYSPATRFGNLLIVGGNGPLDPKTGEVLRGNFEEEVRLTLKNMQAVIEAGGSSLTKVLKVTAYLEDIKNFDVFNRVYSEFFPDAHTAPTRAVVGVSGLWGGISVETECLAIINDEE
ncbi:Rid family detoxifying hydrolase [Aneurinibacillus sp. Ricciae_BoGa-3]|uniref:RidA family protein n=1 Tax=Aneurinibacillus sp. Ricciae_BoGa-3 TaxID=3022697 RepID=UPI002340183D|nr:Rid family detoxifying hydrolase [Aneurinibacillus sp. Ricciae_BoGa-3]WCK53758.1 Rid family detoxifying hydrolase [Aneurinibacillus sp. Ricciae_BoGa-3]